MSACAKIGAVDLDEALGVLEPYFGAAREMFEEAFPLVKRVKFFVARDIHDTPRHFGACTTTGEKILLAPEAIELSREFVIGILAHEFGHAVDYLYPGEFALGKNGIIRRRREDVSEGQWIRWFKAWEKRDDDVIEMTADKIAQAAWGVPIGYAGPCKLQNFRTGEARPQGLR